MNTQKIKIILSSRGELPWLNDFGSRIHIKCNQPIKRFDLTADGEQCVNWENVDSLGVQFIPMAPPPVYDPYANFHNPYAAYDPYASYGNYAPTPEPAYFIKNYYDPMQMTCMDCSGSRLQSFKVSYGLYDRVSIHGPEQAKVTYRDRYNKPM